jgi:hypothetical protein
MIKTAYLSRTLSAIIAATMALSFFAFAPLAFAYPGISFQTTPPVEYKVYEGGDYTVSVDLTGYIEDTNVDFYVRGPVGEPSEKERLIETYQYITTENHEFVWDGKLDGAFHVSGPYQLRLEGQDIYANDTNVLTHDFTVLYEEMVVPVISGLGVTIDPFSPDDDGQQDTTTVTFGLNTEADVTIVVKNDSNVEIRRLMDNQPMSAGQVNSVWNGKETGGSLVPDGQYTVVATAENILGTDEVSVPVTVSTEAPAPGKCAGFDDVAENHPDCDAIDFVKSIGAMTGHPDGTFRTAEVLQRDQVAKISLETFNLFNSSANYCDGTPAFPDVPASAWSFQYVCRGVDLGMITGYESGADAGKYVPGRSVNRVEFLALILRNVSDTMPSNNSSSYNDVPSGQWFSGFAKYAYDNSLFTGTNLNPTQQVTRLEVAQVLYKLDQLGKL